MNPVAKVFSAEVGGKTISFETGKLAGQAGGAVSVRLNQSLIFAAATMASKPRENVDFLPLSVDFEERMYAGGRIPGSFFRREGRPSENAILTSRLTDRPLRPLFPKGMRNEIQVIMYAISADTETPLDVLAINAASAAVHISDTPWNGPIGAVRIGRVDGNFIVNPTFEEIEAGDLDLRVAGSRDAILMVEAGADQVTEEDMVAALELAHKSIQPLIDVQEKMRAEVGKPKADIPLAVMDPDLKARVLEAARPGLADLYEKAPSLDKAGRDDLLNKVRDEVLASVAGEDEAMLGPVREAFESAHKAVVRERILNMGARPDGRKSDEIRPIWCDVDYAPMAHGSGIFTRGETQILTIATLGTPRDAQMIDGLTPQEEKRYLHHYNFPPFSTGEVRFLRGSSRREIGHGALAERALLAVIPDEKEFPYTLRLVSEALSSNGSTSMGSVCGSTLALMDTGVPIKAPVSGIAMGLIKEGEKYAILSDIQGLEDHLGDMDFKVAGTPKGITALQMDIKISGLTPAMMAEALNQAKAGRAHILDKMMETLSAPRPELKAHAPRIITVQIPVDKIGAVIGPGGKTIRAIQESTGAKIDIGEDGTVFIATSDGDAARMAREQVERLTESVELGRIYTGKVVRVVDFGAFVELIPGQDGLVHISQLDTSRVERVADIADVGDEITVMVTDIDSNGKVRLSRLAVLEGWTLEEARERDKPSGPRGGGGGGRGGDRGGRGGGDRNRGGDRGGRR